MASTCHSGLISHDCRKEAFFFNITKILLYTKIAVPFAIAFEILPFSHVKYPNSPPLPPSKVCQSFNLLSVPSLTLQVQVSSSSSIILTVLLYEETNPANQTKSSLRTVCFKPLFILHCPWHSALNVVKTSFRSKIHGVLGKMADYTNSHMYSFVGFFQL